MTELLILSGLVLSPLLAIGTALLLRRRLARLGRLPRGWCLAALAAGGACVQAIVWMTPEPVLWISFATDFELGVKTPLIEEGLKALAVLAVCLGAAVRDDVDGASFGAIVGLGFALLENHRFFMAAPDVDTLLMLYGTRTFLATTGHAMTTALVGAAIGWFLAERRPPRLLAVVGGFAAAALLHGGKNVFGPAHSEWWFVWLSFLELAVFAAMVGLVYRRADQLTAVTQ